MGDVPVLWECNWSNMVGHFDLDHNEIVFNQPFIVGGPGYELTPVIKVLEKEEVDGVTFIKKAKLLALGLTPIPIERIGQ